DRLGRRRRGGVGALRHRGGGRGRRGLQRHRAGRGFAACRALQLLRLVAPSCQRLHELVLAAVRGEGGGLGGRADQKQKKGGQARRDRSAGHERFSGGWTPVETAQARKRGEPA